MRRMLERRKEWTAETESERRKREEAMGREIKWDREDRETYKCNICNICTVNDV